MANRKKKQSNKGTAFSGRTTNEKEMKQYKYKGYTITRHIYKVFENLQQIGMERWYEVTATNVLGYTFACCGTVAEAKNYINNRINNL